MGENIPAMSKPSKFGEQFAQSFDENHAHMNFCEMTLRSETKVTEFLSGPLTHEITALPGCGEASKKAMEAVDIFTCTQLAGQFMLFDRDCTRMVPWLEENGWANGW